MDKRAKSGPEWQKIMSVSLHISGTVHHMIVIFGTRVKWWYLQQFFSFFKILIFWVFYWSKRVRNHLKLAIVDHIYEILIMKSTGVFLNEMFYRNSCSTKNHFWSVPLLEYSQKPWEIHWKEFIFGLFLAVGLYLYSRINSCTTVFNCLV